MDLSLIPFVVFVVIVVPAFALWLVHDAKLHALLGQSGPSAAMAAEVIARERADQLWLQSCPPFTLSDDPSTRRMQMTTIRATVPAWPDFVVDEYKVLAPYLPAGDALTPELRRAIVEAARRDAFLESVEAAKRRAAHLIESGRKARDDAGALLSKFIADHEARQSGGNRQS